MKPEFESLQVDKNQTSNRFELTVDGYTAFIDYVAKPNVIALVHTESPEELKGRGVASALIEKTLNYIKENNLKLIPLCPLVFAYIQRHPEWISIVKDEYKDKFENN